MSNIQEVMRELAKSVSIILGSMNSAGNVLADYNRASGTTDPDTIADAQTDLLLTSMQDMLHRKHLFQVRYVKSEQQLSVESFYLVSMIFLLILLIGVMCAGNFIRSVSGNFVRSVSGRKGAVEAIGII